MKIKKKLMCAITMLCMTTTGDASYMFDMTQDRPINGLMPVPDQIYLPTGNLPSLMRCHSETRKQRRTHFGMRALREQYAQEEACHSRKKCCPWNKKLKKS